VAKQFASQLALIAFFVSSVRGLLTRADFEGTVQNALLVTSLFFCLGWVLGQLARLLIEENARSEIDHFLTQELEPDQ